MADDRKDLEMDMHNNFGVLIFSLVFTAFLLVLAQINHSRDTRRYRILKLSLWILLVNRIFDVFRMRIICGDAVYSPQVTYVIFVGYYLTAVTVMIQIMAYMFLQLPQMAAREQLLHTVFLLCECTAVVLVLLLNLTGFFYTIEGSRFISGIGDEVFFAVRLMALAGFFFMVLSCRRSLTPKLFQNWTALLVLSAVIHCLPFFVQELQVFGFFADVFLATTFFLFHCGTYEEGTARMGTDMYRSELDYDFAKKKDFYIYELQIRNYDRLVERRLYSEEELEGFYGMVEARLTDVGAGAMVFRKKHTSLGVLISRIRPDEAAELAEKMRGWMNEFFAGRLVFGIVAVRCPKYARQFVDAERLLRFLQKKCPENSCYFCEDADYEEFWERDRILRMLHDMKLEKQDVVLFGRPIIAVDSARVKCFEILCRLQMAGSGIIQSEQVIRLAEQYGYIHDVNMAVLAKVCDFLATDTAVRENVQVSLHISGEELENPGFAEDVVSIIKDYDLKPERLSFEVTLSPGEGSIDRMRKVMNTLCGHRVEFVLTDFEPVNVNFESILGLPFKMIKFERHCIKRASDSVMCYDVMGMLVDLLKELGFGVAFKGIDNMHLEEIAMSLRADFLQGEKYTKPFPIEQLETQPDLQTLF